MTTFDATPFARIRLKPEYVHEKTKELFIEYMQDGSCGVFADEKIEILECLSALLYLNKYTDYTYYYLGIPIQILHSPLSS